MAVDDKTGLPAELHEEAPIWESVLGPVPGRGVVADLQVRRIYDDGRLFTYSNSRRTVLPDGRPGREKAQPRWRLTALLASVDEVQAVIRETFVPAPARHGRAGPRAMRRMEWRAQLSDGTLHRVESLDNSTPSAVTAVEAAAAKAIVPGGVPLEQPE